MPPVPNTRNVLDHATARSVRVGLKPPGLGLTIGCCAVSSGHSGTLLTGLGRQKPEPERGQNRLQLRPLLVLSVAGTAKAGTAAAGSATAVTTAAGTNMAGTPVVVSTAGTAVTAGT